MKVVSNGGLARQPYRLPEVGFVRAKHLTDDVLSIGRTTLYAWMKAGVFPAPVRLGPKAVGWRVEDVRAWLASREPA
jgi:prophage regulatory protein